MKKLQHAQPAYYCRVLIDNDNGGSSECWMSPYPDCRRCKREGKMPEKQVFEND